MSADEPIHSWLAADAEATEAASQLGVSLVFGEERDLTESYSRIFLLGDGHERRVLKIRARWMTEGRLSFEQALARHLYDRGLPTVLPLSDEQGRTWIRAGGFYCELLPYVDGRDPSPAPADVRLMGEMLGQFHVCSGDVTSKAYEPPCFQNQAEPREFKHGITQLREQFAKTANSEVILGTCDQYEELAAEYQDRVPSLPRIMRHGDFHPWNMLFRHGKRPLIAALFDLDMSDWGPRVLDVSYAISMLRRLFLGWKVDDWDSRYRCFIEGYTQASGMPLRDEEIACVPLVIKCIAMHFVAQKAGGGFQEALDECREYEAIAGWLKSWGTGHWSGGVLE